jgi:hypothetical protein
MGQNAAVGQATQGMNFAANVGNIYGGQAANVGNLYGQIGAAQAGGALAQGQATANMYSGIASGIGYLGGQGVFNNMFGGSYMAPETSIRAQRSPRILPA